MQRRVRYLMNPDKCRTLEIVAGERGEATRWNSRWSLGEVLADIEQHLDDNQRAQAYKLLRQAECNAEYAAIQKMNWSLKK